MMKTEQLYSIFLLHQTVTTDSRKCPEGSIFFALKGENFDGNRYAAAALEKGCAYAVVDKPEVTVKGDNRYILVQDVLTAMQDLATYHRRKLHTPIIQVTGTNGKTTTKELLNAVLSCKFHTLCTEGNLNNHIGVPLTLLRLRPEHQIAIVETGANHPGEIAFLCNMVQANYGLITNVGRAHLEGFGSFEGVKRTKGELYDDLKRRSCPCFINANDQELMSIAQDREIEIIPYVKGEVKECNPMLHVRWYDQCNDQWHNVATHLIGSYNIANILSAVSVGLYFGVPARDIDLALASYIPTNNRSEFKQTEHNNLIIDAYNANPTSMAAALENFRQMTSPHKMVILGEMRELGKDSMAEHQKIISILASMHNLENIWLVGENFAQTDTSSLSIPFSVFANVEQVKAYLAECSSTNSGEYPTGCTILIKGSNGTKLFLLPELL